MFSDFQCSFCREAANYLEANILRRYAREVRFVHRQLPLRGHDWASTAARVGVCVNLQKPELFWKYHQFVFENQARLTLASFSEEVTKFVSSLPGINSTQLYSCLGSTSSDIPLLEDRNLASALGVEATPVFFINGKRVVGFANPDELKDAIERAVRQTIDASLNKQ